MKNLKSLLLLFAASLTLTLSTSCSSSSDEPVATTETPSESGSYWPSKVNNVWNYSANGGTSQPTKMVSNNNGYFQFENYFGANSSTAVQVDISLKFVDGSYFIKYSNIRINAGNVSGTQTGFEAIILKDNVEVGATWNSDYNQTTTYTNQNPIQTTVVFKGTIISKGTTLVVGSTTYNDVIQVQINQIATSPSTLSITNSDYYFAKNIGLIKYKIISGSGSQTNLLTSYTLN
jgi:hypothetical protein